ncbi:MAG: hypothetical protein HEQ22_05290 [Sphingopyxis sp.]|uniref:hypothetical protein n=1 Tax=Sphingopyxis sp. TaxID=1908224 RepID=UPI003D810AAD
MSTTSDYYLTQAEKCAVDAATSTLIQVRDRSLRAEQAWRQMADRVIRTEAARAEKDKKAAIAVEEARNSAPA